MGATNATLPPHTVRVSKKARRISLRLVAGKGLELVLPLGTPLSVVPDVLQRHATWIERQLAKRPHLQGLALPEKQSLVPETIFFSLTSEFFQIKRLCAVSDEGESGQAGARKSTKRERINPEPGVLLLPHSDEEAIKKLRAWLLRVARVNLGAMLEAASKETGLPYSSFGVGLPRTRWGSCTYKKGIRLNARLMFVSPELVRSVIIHELCHTVHLNHGPKFHALVQQFDAEEWVHHKQLKDAERVMPSWVY